MKQFDSIAFDAVLCRRCLGEFRALLAEKDELSEREDIQPFFRGRPQLAVLFGMFNSRIGRSDRIAWEFDVFGDFACDLAVGDYARGCYCFVEFEDGRTNSIFAQQGAKATREWGNRFDHGYSQIVDWFHKLADLTGSNDFQTRFNKHTISYEAVLVVGRDQFLRPGEAQRLRWRSEHVVVNSKKIYCLTFDELLSQFADRLDAISPAVSPSASKKPRKGKP